MNDAAHRRDPETRDGAGGAFTVRRQGLTPLSRPGRAPSDPVAPNLPKSPDSGRMAWAVHRYFKVLGVAGTSLAAVCAVGPTVAATGAVALSSGCVWPAPLDIESTDGGPGSPPVIMSSGPAPEFSFPGPLVLDRNENPPLSLTLRDNDVEDELYVRLYVDYGAPDQRPARSSCVIPPSGAVERVGQCAVTPVCGDIPDNDESAHFLEAMVADRPFLDETNRPPEQSPYRGVPADASFSIRAWTVKCLAANQ